MAKKELSVDPRKVALEALAASIGDSSPKVLLGTKAVPGFFTGSAVTVKQAAEICLKEDWLEDTGQKSGKGAKAKSLFRLSAKGLKAVLENNPTTTVLEGIRLSVSQQKEQLQSLVKTFETLKSGVQRVGDLIQDVAAKVQPPNIDDLLSSFHSQTKAASDLPIPIQEVDEYIIRSAGQHNSANPLPLPDLFRTLRSTWPAISIGVFHDRLRSLRENGRIKFAPYTRSYAAIAIDREAMFWNGEVVYYVFAA